MNKWIDPITGDELSDNVYHLKSLLWPGYHLFRTDKDHFSFYVGYGNKYHIDTFYPRFEYDIQDDESEINIQVEVSKPVESKLDDEDKIEDED